MNCKVDDDRRGLIELEERKEIKSERYLGAWPWRILYVRRRTLNVIRWCMGSQCMDSWNYFVIWSCCRPINQIFDVYSMLLQENYEQMKGLIAELKSTISQIAQGGGEKKIARHVSQGKMLVRERITTLLDPG